MSFNRKTVRDYLVNVFNKYSYDWSEHTELASAIDYCYNNLNSDIKTQVAGLYKLVTSPSVQVIRPTAEGFQLIHKLIASISIPDQAIIRKVSDNLKAEALRLGLSNNNKIKDAIACLDSLSSEADVK